MKKDIHPEYREVVFKDSSCDFAILTRSAVKTDESITWEDGNTYPLVNLDISSGSHPFFTGKQKLMDTAGRIDRLKKKFGNKVVLGSQSRRKAASPVKSIREKLREKAKENEGSAEGTPENK